MAIMIYLGGGGRVNKILPYSLHFYPFWKSFDANVNKMLQCIIWWNHTSHNSSPPATATGQTRSVPTQNHPRGEPTTDPASHDEEEEKDDDVDDEEEEEEEEVYSRVHDVSFSRS